MYLSVPKIFRKKLNTTKNILSNNKNVKHFL